MARTRRSQFKNLNQRQQNINRFIPKPSRLPGPPPRFNRPIRRENKAGRE